MRIEVKGRNVAVTDELRERVERRFEKIARQVSDLARMEVELSEERNPAIKQSQVAEATLYLKGVTLRARDASTSMAHAINLVAEDIARQVKRHREKRRGRREAREAREARMAPPPAAPEAPIAPPPAAS
jgi:putative sigma-54 modulation protein